MKWSKLQADNIFKIFKFEVIRDSHQKNNLQANFKDD